MDDHIEVYIPSVVKQLQAFYGDLLFSYSNFDDITSHLAAISEKMHQGVKDQTEVIYRQLNNYNPKFIGQSVEQLLNTKITMEDCLETSAAEYGFGQWDLIKDEKITYNIEFEQAVNDLISGRLDSLQTRIKNNPALTKSKSNYGHQATLLHYIGSNGVEFWRQQVPLNLAEITSFLLDSGADKNAGMKVYGGLFNTYDLLTTSAHPYEAGLVEEMKVILG